MRWRIVGVEVLSALGAELTIGSDDPDAVAAIERAAERNGITLERIECGAIVGELEGEGGAA